MKIVKVTAMWCMSCLTMKKVWKSVFKEYPNLEIIDLDYDFNEEEVKQYNIGMILPELVVFKDGKEITRIIGEKSKSELETIMGELNEKN
ncbi:thioredoxin family protein [Mycoplasmatota bacterium WC30]